MKNLAAIFVLVLFISADAASAQTFTINSGTTVTTQETFTTSGTLTVNSGGKLVVSGTGSKTTNDVYISATSSTITIVNSGTISQTTSSSSAARGIRQDGTNDTLIVTNNATGSILTAGNDDFQMNTAGIVTMYNYGVMSAAGSGAQGINWNVSGIGANTLYNYSSGSITTTDADAVRPGANGVVFNSGTMKSGAVTGMSNDGIDAQSNSGISITNGGSIVTATSGTTGIIEGARHGITGGNTSGTGAYAMTITNNKGGTITGDSGSGVNIDGINGNELVTITNSGTITGGSSTADGDGVDVDGLVNIQNSGTIRSLNAYNDTSEGVTVGGGTIVNTVTGIITGSVSTANGNTGTGRGITLAGVDKNTGGTTIPIQTIYANTTVTNSGLIRGYSDAGIAIEGVSGPTGSTVVITNNAGGVIEGAGSVAVIDGSGDLPAVTGTASMNNETVINYGTIQADGSGKAIALGSGTNLVDIEGGSASINADISGGALTTSGSTRTSGLDSLIVNPGAGNSFTYSHTLSNFDSVAFNSGTVTLSGTSTYTGGTTIGTGTTAAVLIVNGSIAGSATTINNKATLGGNGTVGALTVNSGGTVSPGNSPGTLNAGNTVFDSGGIMLEQVNTDGSTGAAGTNWDQLAIAGTLDVRNLNPGATFQFKLQTLDSSNNSAALASFDPNQSHTWANVITTTGGFVGTFSSNDFSFDKSLFLNSAPGTFLITQDASNPDNLDLSYVVAAPEPSSWVLLLGGLGVLACVRRVAQRRS